MARAIDVASYIIRLQNTDKRYYTLSHHKLIKLLYYCQVGHYKWDDTTLITDQPSEMKTIEAIWSQLKAHDSFTLVENMLDDEPHKQAQRNGSNFIYESTIHSYYRYQEDQLRSASAEE